MPLVKVTVPVGAGLPLKAIVTITLSLVVMPTTGTVDSVKPGVDFATAATFTVAIPEALLNVVALTVSGT